ncbi:MAG: prepilin-type N-terminal cleavage/methylation domain-containing protein [Sedimentisphaerales bacterium]|nr:prepilin-type N-terminal cleavage/methylation domain-containing protein [Sedimentisphaerales bacterium]
MKRSGFTLVELAVVIVIIGVLAAFVVPRFRNSIEQSKAAEAFNYLACVQTAQECYNAKWGTYASDVNSLEIKFNTPKYFTVAAVAAGSTGDIESSWSLTLTRDGASAGYGAYEVIFTEEGFDSASSSIPAEVSPV